MANKRKHRSSRRRKTKKNKFLQWFSKLNKVQKGLLIAATVMIALSIAGIIYIAVLFGKMDNQKIGKDDIVINELEESTGEGYTNFVLFGGDSRTGNVSKDLNTDAIIICSLNNKTREVKMVSVYRDTLLDIGNNKIRKCNSAYSNGGPAKAISMLNRNLDLDIQKYVTVDFSAVVDLVDMVGGIEVDVKEREYKEVNKYIYETGMVARKKVVYLTHGGLQKLDGVQATTYARIRKNVGDDYARTERQRLVIQKVVEKAMQSDLATINRIVNTLFPRISTNFTLAEILGYAKDFNKYSIGETTGFPFEKGSGNVPGRGSSVFPITLKKNVVTLHEFLYGTKDYNPSSTVNQISGEIAQIIGNRKPDAPTTGTGGSTGNTTGTGNGTGNTTNDNGKNNNTETPGTKPNEGDDDTTPGEGGTGGSTTTPGGTTTPSEGGTGGDNTGGTTTGGSTTTGSGDSTNPGGSSEESSGDSGNQ